ncbi:EAL domain-containing protein [Silvibacterium sp.]|uniref:PAS domain-containing protein n=1 Tax=Silvibacterium sp. TaxID=1964179 RepID=UPI0039E6157E
MQNALNLLEEHSHAGMWTLNWVTRELWWSNGTFRLHGLTPGEITPTLETAIEFYTEDSRSQIRAAVAEAVESGKEWSLRLKLRRADGLVIEVMAAGRPVIQDGQVQTLSGVIFDVDAIESERLSRHTTEERLRMLTWNSPDGLVMTDAETRIILANPSFCATLGYQEAELVGEMTTVELTPAEDRAISAEYRRKLWHGELDRCVHEKRYRKRDGSYVWMEVAMTLLHDDHGQPLHFLSQYHETTARRQYEEEIFEAKELAQVTLASIADGVIRTDLNGVITYCNEAAARMVDAPVEELVGRPFSSVIRLCNPAGEPLHTDPLEVTLQSGELNRIPAFTRLRTFADDLRPITDSISPLRNLKGEIIGAVFVFQDASEAISFTEKLHFQANHDFLTGLPNRSAAEKVIESLLEEPDSEHRHHFLFFMDLDHFKVVNDTSGHAAGDLLVKSLAHQIRSVIRTSDFFARFGGDEFVLVLRNANYEAAHRSAERLLHAISNFEFIYQHHRYQITASLGITRIIGGPNSLDRLLTEADSACYLAKNQGRNRFRFYSSRDPRLSLIQEDMNWANKIRTAINEEQFELFHQQINSADGTLLGVECLIRLRDGENGYIFPDAFIPAAERMGLLTQIDRWVSRRALQLLTQSLHDASLAAEIGSYLSINLSSSTVADQEFSSWLLALMQHHPDICSRLRVEITETERINWTQDEIDFVNRLRALGARVMLDDFGMGYNSFDVLKRVRFDGIKLDRQVVRDINSDPVDRALAVASAAIARSMGLQLVAEGVETQADLSALLDLGIHHFQGYMFHRPKPFSSELVQPAPTTTLPPARWG